MLRRNGILGRSPLGKCELAKPYPHRAGGSISASFAAAAAAAVSFEGSVPQVATFTCNGTTALVAWDSAHTPGTVDFTFTAAGKSTCHFLPAAGVAGFFVCAGHCTVVFISGDGQVNITCVISGNIAPGAPTPVLSFLFDAPIGY